MACVRQTVANCEECCCGIPPGNEDDDDDDDDEVRPLLPHEDCEVQKLSSCSDL